MMKRIAGFFKDEEGATMVEYALLVALIAVVCITAVQLIGNSASGKFNEAGNAITNAAPPAGG